MLKLLKAKNLECTGCGACVNACHADAIEMLPNAEGFLEPHIHGDICTACGKCQAICPQYNTFRNPNETEPACYAAWAADRKIREASSSGGIFTLLAQRILREGGVVFGAAMQENFTVRHIGIETVEDLALLRKSKYVQSEIGTAYRDAQNSLSAGRSVLFTGTPCQIAGLKAFLESNEYDNLYTVDLLCHGVPSAKMLRQSLAEQFGDEVVDIDFRPLKNDCLTTRITYRDGTSKLLTIDENAYSQAFHPNLSLRESCFDCKFSALPRTADISLGDFWQIHEFSEALGREKGVSAVLINSARGRRLADSIKDELGGFYPVPLKYLSKNRINPDCERHPRRAYFKKLYKDHSFARSVKLALNDHYDIGLVGNWSYPNYGSNLTYYALYTVLEDMHYSVRMIGWPLESEWKPYAVPELFENNPYPEYAVAPLVERRRDMRRFNDECDTFILGSDQLLNNNLYRWFDKFMQLDWAYSTKRKIAYAASFGTDYTWGTPEDRGEMAHFMRQFDAFSVREDSGVRLAKEELGIDAAHVLDPVFLADVSRYHALADAASVQLNQQDYLFSYTLDYTREKEEALDAFAKTLGCEMHVAVDAAKEPGQEEWQHETMQGISIERWLAEIRGSRFMITDSFHGTCFAILFRIPFVSLCNAERGITRFKSILKLLGLEDRLVYSAKELIKRKDELLAPIDFDDVYKRLDGLRAQSHSWLENALKLPIQHKTLSEYDLLGRIHDYSEDSLNGRVDYAIGRIDQDKADINGRMDWAIGRIDQNKADINGRVDYAIGRIDQDKADINGRMDWAIGRIDQDKADINGRMDWAIGRIDRDRELLEQENERLRHDLQQAEAKAADIESRLAEIESLITRIRATIPFRVMRWIKRSLKALFRK